jgi:hypothetical protein
VNRREMLTGMAVAGATVALSTATIATSLPASRAAWDEAMADFERTRADRDAYEPTLDNLGKAIQAGKEEHRADWEAAFHHADKMDDAVGAAETVLLDMPAPDGEALLWKVNRLYKPGEGIWSAEYEAQTSADLHRFLSNGRA